MSSLAELLDGRAYACSLGYATLFCLDFPVNFVLIILVYPLLNFFLSSLNLLLLPFYRNAFDFYKLFLFPVTATLTLIIFV